MVAVLTHQTALADRRKASPLERAYLDCAGDLLHMLSEGTFPNVGDLAMSRSSPRVGDGFIRLDVGGRSRSPARTRSRRITGWGWPPTSRATTS